MKNKRMMMVAVAGLALAAAGVLAQEAKTVSSGKDVYTKKCASCHGKQGEGVPKMATMLKAKIRNLAEAPAPPETLAVWKKIVADGKGKMSSYKAKLSAAEIDSVMAYVHTLSKAAKPKTEATEKAGSVTDSTKGDKK